MAVCSRLALHQLVLNRLLRGWSILGRSVSSEGLIPLRTFFSFFFYFYLFFYIVLLMWSNVYYADNCFCTSFKTCIYILVDLILFCMYYTNCISIDHCIDYDVPVKFVAKKHCFWLKNIRYIYKHTQCF